MIINGEKLGAFIVPTGVGASIGGFAGDASCWARKFAEVSKLIVNPNVVNAGCFSGITENMLYVEGYSLDEFFKSKISLQSVVKNKVGIVFDKAIPSDVLNVHMNTISAVRTVYGVDILGFEITDENVGVEFFLDESGISVGRVRNVEQIKTSAEKLLKIGCEAIAICCLFEESNDENYAKNAGVDPIGGVEAIISHYISKELMVPCAHSPAFKDFQIFSEIVDSRVASEYITPTFLPCILLGLDIAPKVSLDITSGLTINNLDYLVMPFNSLGSVPIFEALKRKIKVFAVHENRTVLDVTKDSFFKESGIILVETYEECLEQVKSL